MTSPPEESPSLLLKLSAELIVWIAEECEPTDLPNLRLSCRELTAASQDAFLERFFCTRYTVLADPTSMRNLVQITAAPQLCKKIKHLRFSLAVLSDDSGDYTRRILECRGDQLRPTCADRAKNEALRGVYRRLTKEWEDYKWTSTCDDLFAILTNLANSKAEPPYISMVDDSPDYESRDLPSAHGRLSSELGYEECLTIARFMPRAPFELVMGAIHLTGFPVKRLACGSARHPIHLAAFIGVTSLTSLRVLELDLKCDNHHFFFGQNQQEAASAMALPDALLHAKQLESLTLSQTFAMAREAYQNVIFRKIVEYSKLYQDQFLPRLRVLRFDGYLGDIALMERFKQLKLPMLSDVVVRGANFVDFGPGPLLMG
ncbi:hypothetical protein M409DRAFT_52953 [Zasmidium cellare ATCC 36951]|uniref:F-box domain-containing protein n=1 Tax=Zasmidium cellare ATCC 36951 TaxID=1080233 RepID=A0A6A6CPA2_ZASCE|nr:uncharacterized protein M409DRAFT_52953 [Zasmidium cellare ATCC 36951]KAF2168974.1 hypothetical protein M409DRAFT_52953 [Zasmidium cellare ATCC 36951]